MESSQSVEVPNEVPKFEAPTVDFKKLSKWRVRVTGVAVVVSVIFLIVTQHHPRGLSSWQDPYVIVSLVALGLGMGIRSWAAALVRKRLVLATTGVYALCRHPLYLGSILMLIGFCGLVGSPVVATLMCGVVIATISVAITAEEQFLSSTFHEAWTDYTARVPRLVPRSFPRSFGEVSFERWRQNHEARVWATVIIGLIAIEVWRHASP